MTYKQARADHEYLWDNYGPADDMTGGYQDSDDLERLLKTPTKAKAALIYHDQIEYWFTAGPDRSVGESGWLTDPEVERIAERHMCDDELENLKARRS